jgi:hypothetical protein
LANRFAHVFSDAHGIGWNLMLPGEKNKPQMLGKRL